MGLDTTSNKPRKQVRDLPRAPKRAVLPVKRDVFVPPPRVGDVGANYRDLAGALSSFSGALASVSRQQGNSQAQADLQHYQSLPVPEQERIARTAVNPATGRPVAQSMVVTKAYGQSLGRKAIKDLEAQMAKENYDWNGSTPDGTDTYLTGQFSSMRDKLAGDKAALEGFDDTVNPWRKNMYGKQTNIREAVQEKAVGDAVYQNLHTAVEETGEYATPEKQKAAIDSIRNKMGPGTDLNASHDQLDEANVKLSHGLATTNPALAISILTEPRKGMDGKIIGPIGSKRKYMESGRTQAILKKSYNTLDKRHEDSVREAVAERDLEVMREEGDLNTFQDHTFTRHYDKEEITITGKERRAEAYEGWKRDSQDWAVTSGETPEETQVREIGELSKLGIENPAWKQQYKGLLQRINPTTLKDPTFVNRLLAAYNLSVNFRNHSPFLASKHIDGPTAKFLDKIYIAEHVLGQSKENAIQTAYGSGGGTGPLSTEQMDALRPVYKKIDEHVKDEGFGIGYSKKFREIARGYVEMNGITPKKALELAEEKMESEGFELGDHWVPLPKDSKTGLAIAGITDDFPELAGTLIQRWYNDYGDPKEYSIDDLTIQHIGNGRYRLIHASNGQPVVGADGNGAHTPTWGLEDFQAQRKAADDAHSEEVRLGIVTKQTTHQLELEKHLLLGGTHKGFEEQAFKGYKSIADFLTNWQYDANPLHLMGKFLGGRTTKGRMDIEQEDRERLDEIKQKLFELKHGAPYTVDTLKSGGILSSN